MPAVLPIVFTIPVVTNGKVYVSANKQVDVYGLFKREPNAAAPLISPERRRLSRQPERDAFQHDRVCENLLHAERSDPDSVLDAL